ncbi:MAG: tetratricopeptide repeat protein [Candidatus Acidiferrales bacterium]
MTRIALTFALLLISAGILSAQQPPPDKQQQPAKQQGQQGQQTQRQSGQDQPDSDQAPVTQESSSKKPRAENEKGGKDSLPDEPPPVSSDAEKAKANANYNPFPAEQDVEVGLFYLHKGDIDAAIDRFLDAIQQRPNFAKPRLLLGKAYEKKHDNEAAVKYYKEYLQVLPSAPDAKEVRKKIEKLSKE